MKIVLDGMDVEVPTGRTILEVARMYGIYIPTLCYLESVNPIGACRICSVEVDGVDSPVMSCVTPVADGMKIKTHTDDLQQYRKQMMQFILVNHPLDCPVCERSGECSLQNLTYEFGVTGHEWATKPIERAPIVDWGLIQYNKNLCILCERCIKICREVQGVGAYKIDGKGIDSRINTVTGEKLDCDFCGQCISVCPVGALSSGMYFSARSWEMEKVESICPHCAVGCSFHINIKQAKKPVGEAKIVRITSDTALGHNNGNLCARGRFGYEFIQCDERITAPLLKRGTGHVATDWDTALNLIAERLAGYKSSPGNAVAGIGSERATNEDNYVFQKFFREVLGSGNLDSMVNMANPDTASLLFENFGDFPMTMAVDELKKQNLFVFIGAEGSNENPVISNHIRSAIMGHGAEVAVAYSKEVDFLPSPKLQIPYDYAGMNGFMLELLKRTVDSIKEHGEMPDAVKPSDELSAKLESAASGVDEKLKERIGELVTLTRKFGKPVYLIGHEAQIHPQATAIVRNVVNLAKITGGKVMLFREYCNSQGVIDMGVAPNILPGYRKETRDELKCEKPLLEQLEEGGVKALIIADEDVLRRHPDRSRFLKAVRKAEFVVVTDQFYTATCMEADVILPSATAASKDGTFTNLEGRIQKLGNAIKPYGQTRPMWEIFADLADRMEHGFGYAGTGDVTGEIAREVAIYSEAGKRGAMATYSGLVESGPSIVLAEAPDMNPVPDDGSFVILGDHQLFSLGLYTDYCPALRPLLGKPYADFHLHGKPFVGVHPSDAERLGASEGDTIIFKHDDGKWEGTLKPNKMVRPGTIRVPDEKDQFPRLKLVYKDKEIDCISGEGLRR